MPHAEYGGWRGLKIRILYKIFVCTGPIPSPIVMGLIFYKLFCFFDLICVWNSIGLLEDVQ